MNEPNKDSSSKDPASKVRLVWGNIQKLIQKQPRIAAGILIVLVGIAGYWGYSKWLGLTRLTLYGNIDIREADLGFRVSGKLKELYKDEGDSVKVGELLGILDPEPLQHQADEAKAQVHVNDAILKNAESHFHRAEALLGTRGISQDEYDTAKAEYEEAVSNLELAKARSETANTSLEDTRLISPSDGVVMTRAQELGNILSAGTTVFSVSLEKPVWTRAYVRESDLGHVQSGKEVEVFTDSHPGKAYRGQIGFVSPQAEFTPKSVETPELRTSLVYRIRIVILNPDPGLRQGMPVTVRIRL